MNEAEYQDRMAELRQRCRLPAEMSDEDVIERVSWAINAAVEPVISWIKSILPRANLL